VCTEEETASGAVAAALRDVPDVCLLDIDVPGGGIGAAATISSQLPQTQVIMLSAAANDADLFSALEAGASGYLLKEMNPAQLGRTLRAALRGEAALPRALTTRLIEEFRARTQSPSLTRPSKRDLTSREWDVLECLCDGLSTRRIAKRLFISQTTVRRHVSSILKKLDVPNRQAAAKVAAQRSQNLNGE